MRVAVGLSWETSLVYRKPAVETMISLEQTEVEIIHKDE